MTLDNESRYSTEEVSNNKFLRCNLIKAYRKTNQISDGIVFIRKYSIVPDASDKYTLSAVGWLIYDRLKRIAENKEEKIASDDLLYCINTAKQVLTLFI